MVHVRGRNVNVAAVAFIVFPTGRLRGILEAARLNARCVSDTAKVS